ncbi:hypothetical protein CYMTET_25806 [Cymbomonas tetramitiformis]|uniref:Uncharacterized protein n=1 Tax=Cymbomonas tetramitiformis TaxID=36881 RepID=A0AAE0KYI0_9CHLO|nr:hypothetical protein CYMTET_25806 [Cymbomonas tetramitiformis]
METQDQETLHSFLTKILVEKLQQPDEYVSKLVSSFQDQLVPTTAVLSRFYHSRNCSKDFENFKGEVLVDGKKVPSIIWAEICLTLGALSQDPSPPTKRIKVETPTPSDQSSRLDPSPARSIANVLQREAASGERTINLPFTPKTGLSRDKSGYAKFWNDWHVLIYQFMTLSAVGLRNKEVDLLWNLKNAPLNALRDLRK